MTFYITTFDYKTLTSTIVSRRFFYNKFVFPEMPEDLMICQGQFLQSVYKDVQWSFEQNLISNICEYHIEIVGNNIYGQIEATTNPDTEQGIVFHKRIDTKGSLWELQAHRFV